MLLGILGGGQLGRMLALSAHALGIRCRILDPDPDACAGQITDQIVGAYNDPDALARFVDRLDLATYEFEHLPLQTLRLISKQTALYPSLNAIEIVQDRLTQKKFLQSLGIPTTQFYEVNSRLDLESAVAETGVPAVLKTRYFGYDGKGQYSVRKTEEIDQAWSRLGERPLVLEAWVPFQRELSLIAVADKEGHVAFYPLIENHHQDHILQWSIAPAPDCTDQQQAEAEAVAIKIVHALRYVGVLTVEFFEYEGQLITNELAPRVHNSGHWTIEGAKTSQFENHLRAIFGLPIGSTSASGATTAGGCSAMFNLIGSLDQVEAWRAVPSAHLHLYGKEARPGRKLGHVTVCADDQNAVREKLKPLNHLPSLSRFI